MDSWTDRCGHCGRGIARVGRAQSYVHANQFHMRFDHPAEPARHTRPEPLAVGGHWGPDRGRIVRRPSHLRVA
ncbi:MAG TPA: hypothetical protein VNU01_03525 [Egibacteraceae bacterium]|nr:hypothetical protein [Egibacteraceae bacterium]